ncbi:stealth family protein [Brevibacterium marinum]
MRIGERLRRWGAEQASTKQKVTVSKLRHREYRWQRPFKERQAEAGLAPERGYDARAVAQDNLSVVTKTLCAAGVEFVVLPRSNEFNPIVVVAETEVQRAVEALLQLGADEGWYSHATCFSGRRGLLARFSSKPEDVSRIRCRRRLKARNGKLMNTRFEDIIIETWAVLGPEVERVDGDMHAEGTLHRRVSQRGVPVEYLVPEMWRKTVAHGGQLALPYPHLYEVVDPVDIVYTWVDGDDSAWRQRKRAVEAALEHGTVNETATISSRFTSRDELKYSLRSVEAYASWVNHIYIVTDGQVPVWLNREHPKITVVDHREIFTDSDALPVFNSHAIESQLHHIPGLSERYVYLNDDIFFLRPTDPSLFFTGNGHSKFFPSKASLDIGPPSVRDLPVLSAAKRNREFLQDRFDRTVTNKFKHTPHPQLRSVLSKMETEHSTEFERVARSTFRHPDDLSIPSALYHFYAYAIGRAIPSSIRYAYMDIAREDAELYFLRLYRRRDLDVLCLNDTNTAGADQEKLDEMMREFLEYQLPIPSTFEKRAQDQ